MTFFVNGDGNTFITTIVTKNYMKDEFQTGTNDMVYLSSQRHIVRFSGM